MGWLVDPAVVGDLGWAGRRAKRLGWAARAASRVARRASSIAAVVPKWTDAGVCQPIPEWRWTWLYSVKNPSRKARAADRLGNDPGKSCRYLRVLNCASENGLSSETRGAGVGAGDAEVGQQRGDWLGGHRGAPVGVDGVGDLAVAGDGLVDGDVGEAGGAFSDRVQPERGQVIGHGTTSEPSTVDSGAFGGPPG